MERENGRSTNHQHHEDSGWTTVNGRSRKEPAKLNSMTSFYFTNIPSGCNETELWKTFIKYGSVSDVYMAKKMSVNGKTFGFVRFLNVINTKSLETSLNTIIIGNCRLEINIASYQHTNTKPPHHNINKPPINRMPNTPLQSIKNIQHNFYANIISANTTSKPKPPPPITIHSCPELTSKLEHSLVGELITIETLPNLTAIFHDNGHHNTRVRYLGGFHVLIELDPTTTIEPILAISSLTSCFKSLKPWNNKFNLKNRLAWISIEGLPPQAWHEAAFSQIASN
nr:RNA-directed DNA polymerase, eukaryota [Tanacetum cinerariifolium]